MRKSRRAVAVTCIALVLFAAFLPLGGGSFSLLVVTPVFVLLPPSTAAAVPREAPRCDERSIALWIRECAAESARGLDARHCHGRRNLRVVTQQRQVGPHAVPARHRAHAVEQKRRHGATPDLLRLSLP